MKTAAVAFIDGGAAIATSEALALIKAMRRDAVKLSSVTPTGRRQGSASTAATIARKGIAETREMAAEASFESTIAVTFTFSTPRVMEAVMHVDSTAARRTRDAVVLEHPAAFAGSFAAKATNCPPSTGRYVVTVTSFGTTPRAKMADATSQRAANASGEESVVAGISSVAKMATEPPAAARLRLRPTPRPTPRAMMKMQQQKRATVM